MLGVDLQGFNSCWVPTPIDLDDPELDAQCRTVLVKLYRLGKYVAEHHARLHAAYAHAQRDIAEIEAEGLTETALEITLQEIEQRVAAGTLTASIS